MSKCEYHISRFTLLIKGKRQALWINCALTDVLNAFNDRVNLAEPWSQFQSFEADHEKELS